MLLITQLQQVLEIKVGEHQALIKEMKISLDAANRENSGNLSKLAETNKLLENSRENEQNVKNAYETLDMKFREKTIENERLNEDLILLQGHKKHCLSQLDELKQLLKDSNDQIKETDVKINEYLKQIDELQQELNDKAGQADSVLASYTELQTSYMQIENSKRFAEGRIALYQSEKDRALTEKKKLQEALKECKQEKEHLNDKYDTLKEDHEECASKLKASHTRIEELIIKLSTLNEENLKLNNQLEVSSEELSNAKMAVETFKTSISKLESDQELLKQKHCKEISQVNSELNALKKSNATNETNSFIQLKDILS